MGKDNQHLTPHPADTPMDAAEFDRQMRKALSKPPMPKQPGEEKPAAKDKHKDQSGR